MVEQVNFVCLWTTQVLSITADDLFHQMGLRCLSSWYPSPSENQTAYSKLLLYCQIFQLLFLHVKRSFHGLSFPFFADWKASQQVHQLVIQNMLIRKNILFDFSITKCSVTVTKRRSHLAICHHLDGNSMHYFGPQESIWEPPSRSEHYKEKCVVCGSDGGS